MTADIIHIVIADDKCPICLKSVTPDGPLVIDTVCGIIYHEECFHDAFLQRVGGSKN